MNYSATTSGPGAGEFLKLIGALSGTRVEIRSLRAFFNRHTATSDPYDRRAQQIRPRYERLVALLEARLRDVKVYRIGTIEIACYILGLDDNGNLAGLRTIAVET